MWRLNCSLGLLVVAKPGGFQKHYYINNLLLNHCFEK
jgi:hypothetical protein